MTPGSSCRARQGAGRNRLQAGGLLVLAALPWAGCGVVATSAVDMGAERSAGEVGPGQDVGTLDGLRADATAVDSAARDGGGDGGRDGGRDGQTGRDGGADARTSDPFGGVWAVRGQQALNTCKTKDRSGELLTFRVLPGSGGASAQIPTGDGGLVLLQETGRVAATLSVRGEQAVAVSASCTLDLVHSAEMTISPDRRTLGGQLRSTSTPRPSCQGVQACEVRSTFAGSRLASDMFLATLPWSTLSLDGILDPNEKALMGGLWFGSRLFLGTWNNDAAARLLGTVDLSAITAVAQAQLKDPHNFMVAPLFLDGAFLYAGSWEMNLRDRDPFLEVNGFDLARSLDGNTWEVVTQAGLAEQGAPDAIHNAFPTSALRLGPTLFLGVFNPVTSPQVWSSTDGLHFTPIITAGTAPEGWSGCSTDITKMVEYRGTLCFSTETGRMDCPAAEQGAQVYCLADPQAMRWRQIATNGFGRPQNHNAALVVCRDQLYAATWNQSLGFELVRYEGEGVWTEIASDGFGQPKNTAAGAACLTVAAQPTMVVVSSGRSGTEIWANAKGDGADGNSGWRLLNQPGFDSGQSMTTAHFVLGGRLHFGTLGPGGGILDVQHAQRGALFRLECLVDQPGKGCLAEALGIATP